MVLNKVLDKIKDGFEKHTNRYYKQMKYKNWNLSDDEKLQIAEYIKHNEIKIEPYFNINNRDTIDKILDSIEQFAKIKGLPINLSTVSQYFSMLDDLDEIVEKIRVVSLMLYPNIIM
jgi:hypothetical protein